MKKHWAIWFWNVLLFSTLPNIHQTCSELTSSIVRHHSLLGVLGQHQHKCLVHGALQRWWGCLVLSSIFSFYLSNLIFNQSLWLPTWSTILLPAWMTTLVASTPWTVSPSCTSGEAVTAVDFFSDFCFSSGYQSCGLKGKFTAGKGNSSLWKPTSFRTLISHTWELSNHTITMPTKAPFRGEGWSFAAFSEWKSIQLRQQFWVCFCQKKFFQHIIGARFDYQTCWCWPTMQQTAWRSQNQGAVYWPNQHQSTVAVQCTTPKCT